MNLMRLHRLHKTDFKSTNHAHRNKSTTTENGGERRFAMRLMQKKMNSRFQRLFYIFFGAALWLVNEQFSSRQALAQSSPMTTPSDEALTLIRKSCFEQKELWGVLVQSCDFREGEIALQVLLDDEQQRKPLEQAMRTIVSSSPRLQQWQSADVQMKSLTVLALRSELLPKLQSMMAANELGDLRTRGLLRRTRLDNARFDYDGGVLFEATSIDEDALKESTLTEKPADCAENRLIIELEEFLAGLLPNDAFEKWRLFNNKVQLRTLKSPVLEWKTRAVANEALDAIELKDAFYDESGKLLITGSVQTIEQRAILFQSFRAFFEASPICRSQQEAQEAIDHLEQSSFGTYVAMLRQGLWEIDSPVARSTWLRRVYFVSPGQAAVEAETFATEITSVDDDANAILMALIRSSHEGIPDPNLRHLVSGFRDVAIKAVPSPAKIVQHAIAMREDMDGSQIDAVAFDSKGQLSFRGQCDAIEKEADLRLLVIERLRAEKHPWADVTFELTMTHEPTRDLLTTIRKAASSWDEVQIDRLWFAEDGHLKVKGEAPEGQTIVDLSKLFRELAMKQLREPQIRLLAENIELDISMSRPSMLKFLRSQISQDKSLEGVCLARGYYDVEGRFVLEAVLDRAEQIESIRALLKAASEAETWKANVPNGWVADSPKTLPLAPLVACLRTAVPAYEALDGIDITSAFHDAENRLSFRGTIFCSAIDAQARLLQATKKLESVLATHADWKPRLGLGVSLVDLRIRPQDREMARLELARSIQQVVGRDFKSAIDHLNVALLNDPKDSTSWFLRGLCHRNLALTSKEADRDFFRAAFIEGKLESARKSRFGRMEQIQGGLRNGAEDVINAFRSQVQSRDMLEHELGIGQCVK